MIAAIPAIIGFAVIPYGSSYTFGDTTINLVVADIDWGVLYIFAIGSIATYGTVIAGWSSNNNWSMLGSMRASAQMISYEVTMGLSVVGVFMVFQTLKLTDMAQAQDTTLRVFGFLQVLFGMPVPAFTLLGWELNDERTWYAVVGVLLLVAVWLALNLVDSPVGRA